MLCCKHRHSFAALCGDHLGQRYKIWYQVNISLNVQVLRARLKATIYGHSTLLLHYTAKMRVLLQTSSRVKLLRYKGSVSFMMCEYSKFLNLFLKLLCRHFSWWCSELYHNIPGIKQWLCNGNGKPMISVELGFHFFISTSMLSQTRL